MKRLTKRAAIALLATVFALTMIVPALSFAQQTGHTSSMTGLVDATTEGLVVESGTGSSGATTSAASSGPAPSAQEEPNAEIIVEGAPEPSPWEPSAELRAPGTCTATIRYLENPWEDDPDHALDDDGRLLLGTYTVTGLHEGDVLHAWDYVIDIPGHFFFDGWPLDLKVTNDPEQNVMTLIYVKLWNCEYTVNYYVMEGADLTADNWSDALKPEGVTFTKVASEKFDNQLFDKLVKGDAYQYQLDGTYVIDTYPAQIRLGLDPDDNVLNVLYTTNFATGPDDVEVSDEFSLPGDSTTPDDAPMPDDTTFDKDDMIGALPGGSTAGSDVYDDFIGNMVRPGELVVTDEMLQHPVNQDTATMAAKAYATGLQHNSNLAQTGDIAPWVIGGLVVLVIVMAAFIIWLARRGHRVEEGADQ